MRIVATSDLHGQLPLVPKCDLLLIAGDICPVWDHDLDYQKHWLETTFVDWLYNVPANRVVSVWGNHDLIGQDRPGDVSWLPWSNLIDEATVFRNKIIYGLPWQRRFHDWAFNLDEPDLDTKYEAIPECDIIVSHGPPYSYGDWVTRDELVGSKAFLKRIDEIKPKLVVFGHIHESPGVWSRNGTILANVTLLDGMYRPRYQPRVFDL